MHVKCLSFLSVRAKNSTRSVYLTSDTGFDLQIIFFQPNMSQVLLYVALKKKKKDVNCRHLVISSSKVTFPTKTSTWGLSVFVLPKCPQASVDSAVIDTFFFLQKRSLGKTHALPIGN